MVSNLIRLIQSISKCQNINGGFGGGQGHLSHVASSFAAISSLTIIGTEEAYKCINR